MRPLPPTLRMNRRYILIEVMTDAEGPSQKELYQACASAVRDLFGDTGAAEIRPAVVWSDETYAVVRCSRGTEKKLTAALACVIKAGNLPANTVRFRTVKTSGTIRGAKAGIPCRDSPEGKSI